MEIETTIPQIEETLSQWKDIIGKDYAGYKHHVYRVVHFGLALKACSEEERKKLITAACFHDIGIWFSNSMNYIPASINVAEEYLTEQGLSEWEDEIKLIISEHHKLKKDKNTQFPLIESFRKADLIDTSMGLFKFGLSRAFIEKVKDAFPNEGYHNNLGQMTIQWFLKGPFRLAKSKS